MYILKTKGKKSFKAKYNKVTTQITGYQISYSTNSKFSSSKTVIIKGYKNTIKTIKKLKSNKKYYAKVRTYKKVNGVNYYSSWSKVKTIKVK